MIPAIFGVLALVTPAVGGELPPGVTPADPPAATGAGSVALASAPSGVLATWIEPRGEASRVRIARFDGGRWSQPETVVDSAPLFVNWADVPGALVAGDGAWLAWWPERTGAEPYAYSIAIARSADGGAHWTRLGWLPDDRSPTEHGFVAMVPEGDGARAFWLDGRATLAGGPMALRTALIRAPGAGGAEAEAVGASIVVDESVCDCCPTAAAATALGAIVAYRDRTPEEIRDVRALRWGGGAPLAARLAGDGWRIAGCPVNGPAVAVAAGRVAAVWFSAPDEAARVAVALSADGGVRFDAPVVVDERAPVGRVGAAPLPDGDFAISWLARAGGERAELRLRRWSADGRLGAAITVATLSAGRGAGIPRLAALPDGRLVLAWIASRDGASILRSAVVDPRALPAP